MTCTDVKCAWKEKRKKAIEDLEPEPLKKHTCFAKEEINANFDMNEEMAESLRSLFRESLPYSALVKSE